MQRLFFTAKPLGELSGEAAARRGWPSRLILSRNFPQPSTTERARFDPTRDFKMWVGLRGCYTLIRTNPKGKGTPELKPAVAPRALYEERGGRHDAPTPPSHSGPHTSRIPAACPTRLSEHSRGSCIPARGPSYRIVVDAHSPHASLASSRSLQYRKPNGVMQSPLPIERRRKRASHRPV